LWFVGRSWERAESSALYQVFDGTQRLLGLLPTGKTPDGADVVSLFWGVRNDTVDGLRARGVDAWKADVRRLTRKADPLLDQITDVDQLIAPPTGTRSYARPGAGRPCCSATPRTR
jgi:hypothetical protein